MNAIHPLIALFLPLLGLALASCATKPSNAFRALDGLPIVFEERGSGAPALVLVHGWCCNRSFWGELPERFAVDHRVVTLDLPGHGQSGKERESWSMLDLGADVAALCEERGLTDLVLVGHSMGAPISLAAAQHLAGRVRGVIAVDSLHDITRPVEPEMIAMMTGLFEADWDRTMREAIESMVPAGPGSPLALWIEKRTRSTNRRAAIGLMQSFTGLDLAALAVEAGVPVRAINAAPRANSPVTLTEENRALADFDAVLLDGVGHYLQLERPDAVEAELRRFLATFAPPPGAER